MANTVVLNDELFLRRLTNGDTDAQRTAARRFAPIIRKSVMRILGARRGASAQLERDIEHEDLVQDVIMAILDPELALIARWDSTRGTSLDGYVAAIASHTARAHLRRFRREQRLRETWGEVQERQTSSLPNTSHRSEAARDIESLLAYVGSWLDPRSASLFQALCVNQEPLHEVCHRFQLSRNAVYAFRFRVRKHLESSAWLTESDTT